MERTECLFPDGASREGMVSVSQILQWLRCRRQWEYSHVDGLSPRVERPYLTVGKMCHAGMHAAMERAWMRQRGGVRASFDELMDAGLRAVVDEWDSHMVSTDFLDEEVPLQEDLLDDAREVFSQALRDFRPERWEPVTVGDGVTEFPALELHFLMPCEGSAGMHGYIDAVLRDRLTGYTWCVDYKFRRSLQDDDEEQYNLQNAVYMRACERMGIPVTGTLTWQHLSTPPADPAITAKGVSRARIRTTWDRYRRFLLRQGLDPADYAEMEDKLATIEWCRETLELRSAETVDRIWDEIVVPAARGIAESRIGGNARSMYAFNCRACAYRELCQAELRGYDADYVRKAQFVRKEHR